MEMMIHGVPEAFSRALIHIVRLFYDEPRIEFSQSGRSSEPMDLRFDVDIGTGQLQQVTVKLEIYSERAGRPFGNKPDAAVGPDMSPPADMHEATEIVHPADNEKESRRNLRMAISRGILRLLEAETGILQPWGILTGVRPTKLLHQTRQDGTPDEAATAAIARDTLVTEEKLNLMKTIVDRQAAALPDLYRLKQGVSLYIGIPFCPTKCAYCTFPAYAIGGRQGSVNDFLSGLRHEMKVTGEWLKARGIPITAIYYGGGTPTSITAEEMDSLYTVMHEAFPMEGVREITVEAGRPDTITVDKLKVLKDWNIDRISINPQSYTQKTLDAIGRHHTVEETMEKFKLAREMGMTNINMDLIIGLPGESTEEFGHTLEQTAMLMPESLTVHTLSFKRASEMTRNKQDYQVAERDEAGAMMKMAEVWTETNGYHPYYLYRQKNILGNLENVGYARPGCESLYNIIIMEEMQSIVGLGCGASSKWVDPATGAISRYANPKEPKAYNDTYLAHTEAKIEALEKLFGRRTESLAVK